MNSKTQKIEIRTINILERKLKSVHSELKLIGNQMGHKFAKREYENLDSLFTRAQRIVRKYDKIGIKYLCLTGGGRSKDNYDSTSREWDRIKGIYNIYKGKLSVDHFEINE